ncbi:hypothetical protein KJ068_30925 [bacterium]|nr:hypothetical protein [bacterium]
MNLLRHDIRIHKYAGADDAAHDQHGGVKQAKPAGELGEAMAAGEIAGESCDGFNSFLLGWNRSLFRPVGGCLRFY